MGVCDGPFLLVFSTLVCLDMLLKLNDPITTCAVFTIHGRIEAFIVHEGLGYEI